MFRFTFACPPTEDIAKLEERARTPNAPCQKQMLAWTNCLKEAQSSFLEAGKDTKDPAAWTSHHLRKCLHPFVDARECQVEKKAAVIRDMKDKMSEAQWEEFSQRQRYAAHKSRGLEQFEQSWRPDLDYTGYFKAYRAHMEDLIKLDDELKSELANGGYPEEPYKYQPKKFVYKGN